ncbi:MAG: 2-C-methyl-D-erythritol 4-phosphate cytidylyltransferase [bacterium]
MIAVVITAAGTGQRFGQDKAMVMLKGKPLFAHSLTVFYKLSVKYPQLITKIIITCNEHNEKEIKTYLTSMIKTTAQVPKTQVILGDKTRFLSVQKAVEKAGESCDKIMIHDAARPAISLVLIERILQASDTHQAVIPGISVVDTIKQVNKEKLVLNTVNRDQLCAIQTPQCFDSSLLKDCYKKAGSNRELSLLSDEAQLVEKAGIKVHVVQGERQNIKCTWPQDLAYLESMTDIFERT